MSRCGGSSTRQCWGTAPTRIPCASPARAPASSDCGSCRRPEPWPAATPAWAAGPGDQVRSESAGKRLPYLTRFYREPGDSSKGRLALDRNTDRIKPAADEDLGVRFAAEMARCRTAGHFQVPFMHRKLHIAALDHEPMNRTRRHGSADFALELAHRRHVDPGIPALR